MGIDNGIGDVDDDDDDDEDALAHWKLSRHGEKKIGRLLIIDLMFKTYRAD